MADKSKLIVANWKMNFNVQESSLYLEKISKIVRKRRDVTVVLAPTTLALQTLSLQVNLRQFKLAVQNFYWRDHGAFTGEVSATQLKGMVQYGLVGHSERRYLFHENDKDIRNKVQAALRNQIKPILCIGETMWERSSGETADVIRDQLVGGLANVTSIELENVIIAYEPIWAIGTGDNASPTDVTDAVRVIRETSRHLYGAKWAHRVTVIYGGSVTSATAGSYLLTPGVDGLLIGGASLDAHQFEKIVETADEAAK